MYPFAAVLFALFCMPEEAVGQVARNHLIAVAYRRQIDAPVPARQLIEERRKFVG